MICTINNVSKMLGGNTIFENLSLSAKSGERIGIVGRNGTGKSTLFQLIAGGEKVDSGSIHFKKGTKIGYVAQIPIHDSGISGLNILKGAFEEIQMIDQQMKQLEQKMAVADPTELEKLLNKYGNLQEQFANEGGYVIESEIEKIINGLELSSFVEQEFVQLSGGEQTKIMLGKMLLTKPNLLLLDEPTNHLDVLAVEWLEKYLRDYDGTILLISHDRYFLDEVVTKIADLEDGEITVYHGNYSAFIKEKEEKLLREFQEYEEQQKKIKKMQEAIKRLRQWANEAVPPNEGLHRQARNMERALERMVKVRKPLIDPKKMALTFEAAPRSGKEVVKMIDASFSYADQPILNSASLHVYWKDRLAIVGRNGTGKSTILHILQGDLPVTEGIAMLGSNVRVGYLSQHVAVQDPKKRVLDVFREEVEVTEADARHILAKFMFYGPDVFKRFQDLSGGERMRLRLAQLMHQDINLLILDEPTNHLDIESQEVLEDALDDFKGTILAVSHDRYFLNKLFTRTAWLQDGKLTTFEGPYDWAKEKMQQTV